MLSKTAKKYGEKGTTYNKSIYLEKYGKECNCAGYTSTAMWEMGWIGKDEGLWNNKTLHDKDGCITKHPEKFDVLHPKKTTAECIKAGILKPGDVVGYDVPHTMAYAGGGLWYSYGPKSGWREKPYKKAAYDNKIIYTIVRYKYK